MAQPVIFNICHLYPDLMNTYGDNGNIITIVKRCQWRGIDVKISNVSIGQPLSASDFDFFFFGGGQDKTQIIVGKDLIQKAKKLIAAINNKAVLLSICGGYQLLQNYFKTKEGEIINGISLFDAYTAGSKERMIQDLLIEIDPELQNEIKNVYPAIEQSNCLTNLIGFENHSGKTYLGKNSKALGRVIKGAGNNNEDHTEGAVYKNAFGCYLHGSLLPKNSHFADYLISKALERRYGPIKLKPLDDSLEWKAHNWMVDRVRNQG
ncbi:glutamine amidotransferase [Candidatus Curtissbacteria bacterium RIFCSPHIGHO2_12_FULL_38_9b]|uniref:Lipid II isoglutaminyl synthase (glutamine-hydrolyzing) subunit GatD n=2 Tax=Candidatus Curtissiibacteriota TaxID=1752717 RepID=A0A1F5GZC6_9BACT|nr:MAG: glutamine amidotransferase [Candidatus Curtissbacteria bacterium RIFCSPLOWO2_01_FULL_37_9]OGD97154.1 MAG: glutamine amidotransferase [Candidatus Curtissbacteria bacterium RIFCSPHIGHO2_12_FULL_38_9b]